MSATLEIINNFTLTVGGVPITGRQGTDDSALDSDPFDITVTGSVLGPQISTLATATAQKVWDAAINIPATFLYAFFKADQDMTIQIIGSATNLQLKTLAGLPFIIPYNKTLAVANTTPIAGSAPSFETTAKIYIQNNSGTTANYYFFLVL